MVMGVAAACSNNRFKTGDWSNVMNRWYLRHAAFRNSYRNGSLLESPHFWDRDGKHLMTNGHLVNSIVPLLRLRLVLLMLEGNVLPLVVAL